MMYRELFPILIAASCRIVFWIERKVSPMTSDCTRLQTSVKDISGVYVVKVAGEVDVYTAPDFKAAINEAISQGARSLVIDLQDVGYMDSSGFGTLLGATKRIKPDGGTIHLAGCSEAIVRMLKITRLDSVFGVYPKLDDAIASAKASE